MLSSSRDIFPRPRILRRTKGFYRRSTLRIDTLDSKFLTSTYSESRNSLVESSVQVMLKDRVRKDGTFPDQTGVLDELVISTRLPVDSQRSRTDIAIVGEVVMRGALDDYKTPQAGIALPCQSLLPTQKEFPARIKSFFASGMKSSLSSRPKLLQISQPTDFIHFEGFSSQPLAVSPPPALKCPPVTEPLMTPEAGYSATLPPARSAILCAALSSHPIAQPSDFPTGKLLDIHGKNRQNLEHPEAANCEVKARFVTEDGKREESVSYAKTEINCLLMYLLSENRKLRKQVDYFKTESLNQRIEAGQHRKRKDLAEFEVVGLEDRLKEQQFEITLMQQGFQAQLAEMKRMIQQSIAIPQSQQNRSVTIHQAVPQWPRTIHIDVHELPATVSDDDLKPLPLKLPNRQVATPDIAPQLPAIKLSPQLLGILTPAEDQPQLQIPPRTEPEYQEIPHVPEALLQQNFPDFDIDKNENDSKSWASEEEVLTEGRRARFGRFRTQGRPTAHRLAFASGSFKAAEIEDLECRLSNFEWSSIPDLSLFHPTKKCEDLKF